MDDFGTITLTVADGVATVTLDRPDVRNAFNAVMRAEFTRLWARVREDDDVRVVVLQANGPTFSAGIDVRESRPAPADPWTSTDHSARLGPKQSEVWKPVIAAVHGAVVGGAFYWVNEADLVLATEQTVFFDPHVSLSRVTSLVPTGLIRQGVPLREALRMALMGTAERITAETALRIGMVNEVVPPSHLRGRAHELARRIAGQPSVAVQGTVKAIWTALDLSWPDARRHGLTHAAIGRAAADPRDPLTDPNGPPPEVR